MIERSLPITDVRQLIPQKPPFVMVDTLLEFSDMKVASSFTVNPENILVEDTALSEPGLIENMAQTTALHTGYACFLQQKEPPTGYIGAIKNVKISVLPQINETITTKAEILHEFMGVTVVGIKVFNAKGEEIASGQMKTVIAG
ncbi:hypothetical protein LS482_19210 [Sinomicrobium kalidii]|uniref:hypothetical protein n=1 Tax=Sinomicrobium kalidii TaxID=2900738 RepID=UPI001E5C9F99|nr:hypothetical protein [Sinomicrobium kalidii]UGU15797.1 hypothetical protein LS482_19210 [Sinomicrobium kalidii]